MVKHSRLRDVNKHMGTNTLCETEKCLCARVINSWVLRGHKRSVECAREKDERNDWKGRIFHMCKKITLNIKLWNNYEIKCCYLSFFLVHYVRNRIERDRLTDTDWSGNVRLKVVQNFLDGWMFGWMLGLMNGHATNRQSWRRGGDGVTLKESKVVIKPC